MKDEVWENEKKKMMRRDERQQTKMIDKGNLYENKMFMVTDSNCITSCSSDLRNKLRSRKYN
jgi:hypothetical protein